jgi:branched-chain amino acid transport system ATP-binding protein
VTLLAIRDLDAGYGDFQVLEGVDMAVADAEYVAIVGPNGAGKSTVMKSVFGLTDHMGGEVVFDGEGISGLRPDQIITRGLNYVPQTDNVFPGLTVEENLEMGAYILDSVPDDRLRSIYDRFPILEERNEQLAGSLSGGQQQMLAMGRGLMVDPGLMLIDEPSAGMAPHLVDEVFEKIRDINEGGTAILMVEQNARKALRNADRGYVLDMGENRFVDDADALLDNEEVAELYLGG